MATPAGNSSVKVFNVGIIGYGLSATVFHIPFIATVPSLKLHSILQRNPSSASGSAPKDHPEIQHFTSLNAFLADSTLDVVVVSTPPGTHFSFTKQALEAGKHVFVEKPFVPSSAEADELLQVSKATQRLICVYQNRRWDADFLTVKKLLSEDKLGRVLEFETHFDRYRVEQPTNWKGLLKMDEGGGALYDLGSHLIDQVYSLFGMPKGVFAKLVSQRDGLVLGPDNPDLEPDSATVQLSYANGLMAFIRIGVLSVEARQPRFWIRGRKGSYRKAGLDSQEPQLRAGMKTSDAKFGREGSEWDGQLTTVDTEGQFHTENWPNVEPPETYSKIYELFAKALQSGQEADVPVPATQARDVLKIIEAAKESGRTNREVALSRG